MKLAELFDLAGLDVGQEACHQKVTSEALAIVKGQATMRSTAAEQRIGLQHGRRTHESSPAASGRQQIFGLPLARGGRAEALRFRHYAGRADRHLLLLTDDEGLRAVPLRWTARIKNVNAPLETLDGN